MEIRPAGPQDAGVVASLLGHLGYPAEPAQVEARLRSLGDADCVLLAEGVTSGRVVCRGWACLMGVARKR